LDSWCFQKKKEAESDPALEQSISLLHATRELTETRAQLGRQLTAVTGLSAAAGALGWYLRTR